MKKVIFGLVAGLAVSANVMAADAGAAIPSGTAIDTTVAAGCSLLSEAVVINLSNNVFGAYACNVVDNIIAVATCHPTGRKGPVTVACLTDATTPVPGCTATPDTGDAANAGTASVQGGLAYTGSSNGGRVGGTNAATCVAGGNTIAEAAAAALP
ncbi:hypothetical protein [Pseudomonas sp.]|uniref:hypothetical protein n=1 Tax=Pseudomonas sp. TaxID=306 RepID=UPI00273137B2|nr:hypothetical protein [Pseudomonas sp.]MDP2244447.1 hypothetical protein [Pseudomonas sp.]